MPPDRALADAAVSVRSAALLAGGRPDDPLAVFGARLADLMEVYERRMEDFRLAVPTDRLEAAMRSAARAGMESEIGRHLAANTRRAMVVRWVGVAAVCACVAAAGYVGGRLTQAADYARQCASTTTPQAGGIACTLWLKQPTVRE